MPFFVFGARAGLGQNNEQTDGKQANNPTKSQIRYKLTVNQPLPSVTYVAIKQLLLCRLQAALDLYLLDSPLLNKERQHISLYRAKDSCRVSYISGIAFQLSKVRNIPALEIATALVTLICGLSSNLDTTISQEFTVQVVPSGLIHLELTEPQLAVWLQSLIKDGCGVWGSQLRAGVPPVEQTGVVGCGGSYPTPYPTPSDTASRLFPIQYAHARCCSLVQLAHREGLIKLKESANNSPLSLLKPTPVPWLNSEQKLRFVHPDELALIDHLLRLLDNLYCSSSPCQATNWEKAALNLSRAFQKFYSSSRIWGEVKTQTPHLAQARLGLVIATQSVLQFLLQDLFGVYAPLELS